MKADVRFWIPALIAFSGLVATLAMIWGANHHPCVLKRCGSQDVEDCKLCREENLRGLLELYRREHGRYPPSLLGLHWAYCSAWPPPWDFGVTYQRTASGYEAQGETWVLKK